MYNTFSKIWLIICQIEKDQRSRMVPLRLHIRPIRLSVRYCGRFYSCVCLPCLLHICFIDTTYLASRGVIPLHPSLAVSGGLSPPPFRSLLISIYPLLRHLLFDFPCRLLNASPLPAHLPQPLRAPLLLQGFGAGSLPLVRLLPAYRLFSSKPHRKKLWASWHL